MQDRSPGYCGNHYLQEQHARIGPPHRGACGTFMVGPQNVPSSVIERVLRSPDACSLLTPEQQVSEAILPLPLPRNGRFPD